MNFILAVAILSFLFGAVGVAVPGKDIVINQVVKNSPADIAGIKKGDTILFVENVRITSTQQLVSETKKHLGGKISVIIRSGPQTKTIIVAPRKTYPKDQLVDQGEVPGLERRSGHCR